MTKTTFLLLLSSAFAMARVELKADASKVSGTLKALKLSDTLKGEKDYQLSAN